MSEQHSSCAQPVEQNDAIEYRDVPGFPGYRVGSDGTVWTSFVRGTGRGYVPSDTWKPMAICLGSNNYRMVGLTRNGKRCHKYVHELVLEAFIGPRPLGMQACHFPDQSKGNNKLDNLRWDTPSANNADKVFHGTHQAGERNGNAKLTSDDVRQMRLLASTGMSYAALGRKFGVTKEMASLIVRRKYWKQVS